MNKEYTDALVELESHKRYHKMICCLLWIIIFLVCFGTHEITKIYYKHHLDACAVKSENMYKCCISK